MTAQPAGDTSPRDTTPVPHVVPGDIGIREERGGHVSIYTAPLGGESITLARFEWDALVHAILAGRDADGGGT